MANMKKTKLHHLFHTKAQEDEFKKLNYVPSPQVLSEIVEIRDGPLQALELFPWEMTKVLNQNDLKYLPGLELNREFAHKRLFKHWDENTLTHTWVRQKSITIKMHDIDTKTNHDVTFQKCFNIDKYYLQGGWTTNFVERRGLSVGMQIGMYWDIRMSTICFSVLKETPEFTGSSRAVPNNTPESSKGRLDFELSLK